MLAFALGALLSMPTFFLANAECHALMDLLALTKYENGYDVPVLLPFYVPPRDL